MNHAIPVVTFAVTLSASLSLFAQTETKSDKKAPEFTIKWETKHRKDGREITMREVQAPIFPKVHKVTPKPIERNQPNHQFEPDPNYHWVSVSATVYDRKATYLKIHSQLNGEKQVTEAWSNVDWRYFGGVASFEGRGQTFNFLMMAGESSIEALKIAKERNPNVFIPEIPRNLPKLTSAGPRYTVGKEAASHEVALDFLEAIHDLYKEKETELIETHEKRVADHIARQEQLRLNPPKKKDVEVHFWNNDVNK